MKYCTRYRFRTERPPDRDAMRLVLVCDKWQVDNPEIGKSYVLTTDHGWVELERYATFQHLNIPEIGGIDLYNAGKVEAILKDWEERMVALVAGFNVRPDDWD